MKPTFQTLHFEDSAYSHRAGNRDNLQAHRRRYRNIPTRRNRKNAKPQSLALRLRHNLQQKQATFLQPQNTSQHLCDNYKNGGYL